MQTLHFLPTNKTLGPKILPRDTTTTSLWSIIAAINKTRKTTVDSFFDVKVQNSDITGTYTSIKLST
ncbi:hypothetical protein T10_12993, partial [Trichinella papuae]